MENGQVKETLKFFPQKGQIKILIFPCRIRRILETFCSPGFGDATCRHLYIF